MTQYIASHHNLALEPSTKLPEGPIGGNQAVSQDRCYSIEVT